MSEHTEPSFVSLLRREIDDAVDNFPRYSGSIIGATRHTRRPWRIPRLTIRWRYAAPLVALAVALGLILVGLHPTGSKATRSAYRVAGWTVWVANAQAATSPTAAATVIANSARAQYLSMAHRLQPQGVYLANDPVVELAQLAHGATKVRFPSGTLLSIHGGAHDIWYVTVGSRREPSNTARQVNMVFSRGGSLLRALPAERPAMLHAPTLRVSELGSLAWQDVPTKLLEQSDECTDPGCPPVTATPHPDATLGLATAQTDTGDVVFDLSAAGLAPDTTYFLETGAGIAGSAQTDSSGTLVAVMTLSADDVTAAKNGQGNGVVDLTGHGFEKFFACPFGGTVSIGTTLASCG